jgi:hypothetical protein
MVVGGDEFRESLPYSVTLRGLANAIDVMVDAN